MSSMSELRLTANGGSGRRQNTRIASGKNARRSIERLRRALKGAATA